MNIADERYVAAVIASIETRVGQIEKACENWTANSVYQIQRATGSLKDTARSARAALLPNNGTET